MILIPFIIFYFGCIIGSFLNVVILRLPREETLQGHSHCMHCGHELSALELFPLFSYVLLAGKCRNCRAKISPRYFAIECITGLLFVISWFILRPENSIGYTEFVRSLYFISAAIVIFVIDYEQYLIFDSVVFPSVLVIALFNIILDIQQHQFFHFHSFFINGLMGAFVGSIPFFLVWYFSKGKWMGFGDVKLMILLGSLLGMRLIWIQLLVAVVSGGLISIGLLLFSNKELKSQIPFGTFLVAAAVVCLWYGEPILHWYLSILGF